MRGRNCSLKCPNKNRAVFLEICFLTCHTNKTDTDYVPFSGELFHRHRAKINDESSSHKEISPVTKWSILFSSSYLNMNLGKKLLACYLIFL